MTTPQQKETPVPPTAPLDDTGDIWNNARTIGIIACIILILACIIFGIYILVTRSSTAPTTLPANRAARWGLNNSAKIK
jgi:hypothetical protein